MASIIRSPTISDERRILTTRRARAEQSATTPPIAPVSPAAPAPAQAAPKLPPPPSPAVPDVASLVAQARESVLAQFKDEAEKARELGRQRGLQEGRKSGAEEAAKSFELELARVRSIADKLQQAAATGFKGLEDMAVAIAFEAVCKMMGTAAVTREGIQALVTEAATHAFNSERLVVRLHPGDLAALRDAGALDAALPSGALVSWTGDQGIALGGCIGNRPEAHLQSG
jgi:flagellar assembly protein FliH